jgi:hypothetical protein
MSIEIVALTSKGEALSHSVRHSSDVGWRAIYFLRRMGNRSTFDRICNMCYGGDVQLTKHTVANLKAKGIVVGE